MKQKLEQGFTLVELIGVIVILGLISSVGALGFGNIIEGFVFAQDNADIAQKAQAALTRIEVELMYACPNASGADDTVGTRTQLTYNADFWSDTTTPDELGNALVYDAGAGTVTLNNQELVDGVTAFSIDYFTSATEASPSTSSSYVSGTTQSIGVNLTLTGANDVPQLFQIRVRPTFLLGV